MGPHNLARLSCFARALRWSAEGHMVHSLMRASVDLLASPLLLCSSEGG